MPAQPVHTFALFAPELSELLAAKDPKALRRFLSLISPLDLAEGWKTLAPDDRLLVFKLLGRRRAVVLFETLEVEQQAQLIEELERDQLAAAADAAVPDVSDLPSSAPDGGGPLPTPPARMDHLIRSLNPRTLKKLSRFLSQEGASAPVLHAHAYPEGTVGKLMHPPSVPLHGGLTARQALERFQAVLRPGSPMPVSMLFVVGRDGTLLSAVELRDLLAAPPDMRLSEMASSVELIKLPPGADQEEAARLFERYELSAAPVVDDGGRLIGIITTDDILHVMKKEASEDIAKLAGTSAEELRSRSIMRTAALRMPWLLVTIAGGCLVSLIIRNFESTLRQLLALASFTPLIAAMGGNVGTQSSTIVVRGLATGEIAAESFLATAWRESRAGMTLGAVYGLLAGGAAWGLYGAAISPKFAFVVGGAMWVSMSVASTMGAVVPFLLKRYGADPANATGPFITTSTDILTTLLYLSVATAFLL